MNFPLPGTLVAGPNGAGSLRLERVLGNGAFGLVYKAIDTTDQMPYAVKFPLALVDFQGAVELHVVCRISIRFFLPITFRRTVLEQPIEQINTMRQRMSPAT